MYYINRKKIPSVNESKKTILFWYATRKERKPNRTSLLTHLL